MPSATDAPGSVRHTLASRDDSILRPPQLRGFHTTEFRFPFAEGALPETVSATQLGRGHAGLGFFKDIYNLVLAESRTSHGGICL